MLKKKIWKDKVRSKESKRFKQTWVFSIYAFVYCWKLNLLKFLVGMSNIEVIKTVALKLNCWTSNLLKAVIRVRNIQLIKMLHLSCGIWHFIILVEEFMSSLV